MSVLEDLVPPLELCKLISEGEFGNSALVWYCKEQYALVGLRNQNIFGYHLTAPAPTLQEIMDALICRTNEPCVQWNGGWYVSGDRLIDDGRPEVYNSASSVTAALKLWLEVKDL